MFSLSLTLRRLLVRHPAAVPLVQDPADMGTCLGLEMTLGAALPQQPQAVAAPAHARPVVAHWWQRPMASKAQLI